MQLAPVGGAPASDWAGTQVRSDRRQLRCGPQPSLGVARIALLAIGDADAVVAVRVEVAVGAGDAVHDGVAAAAERHLARDRVGAVEQHVHVGGGRAERGVGTGAIAVGGDADVELVAAHVDPPLVDAGGGQDSWSWTFSCSPAAWHWSAVM